MSDKTSWSHCVHASSLLSRSRQSPSERSSDLIRRWPHRRRLTSEPLRFPPRFLKTGHRFKVFTGRTSRSSLRDKKPGEERTAIGIYDTHTSFEKLPWDSAIGAKKEFFDGRRDYVDSIGATGFGDEGARTFSNASGLQGIELTFSYEVDSSRVHEASYYLLCNSHYFFVKAVFPHSAPSSENLEAIGKHRR